MKKHNLKRGLLILVLTGPVFANLSCSGAFLEQFRDAMLSGAVSFVEQTTFNLLDVLVLPSETDE